MPAKPGKRRVARNMKKLREQAAQARAASRRTPEKGRVHCPLCSNSSTRKLYQKGGQTRRECNRCNEEFWSVK